MGVLPDGPRSHSSDEKGHESLPIHQRIKTEKSIQLRYGYLIVAGIFTSIKKFCESIFF